MELIGRILFAAVLAGAVAGLVSAGLQQWRVVPLIVQAESYEGGGHSHGEAAAGTTHTHEDGTEHTHAAEGAGGTPWAPAEGFERAFFTVLATTLVGIGFALVIGAASMVTGIPITPTSGVLWGLAGFAAFNLAPAIGLPPELPGMAAAELTARQIWWWGTVIATGLAALTMAWFRNWMAVGIGAALILAPHVIGAPPAPEAHSELPAHLATTFAANALGAALVFWLICGSLYGYVSQRFLTEEA